MSATSKRVMDWKRSPTTSSSAPWVLFLVVCCVQHLQVTGDECGTRFIDPTSSTVRAQIVLKGSMANSNEHQVSEPGVHSANITIDEVFKGAEILQRMGLRPRVNTVMVDRFSAQEDREGCVASMPAMMEGEEHMFFLQQSSSRGVLQITAIPLPAKNGLTRKVKSSLCDTCIRPPRIKRVRCRKCARAPVIRQFKSRKVALGKRGRLRCAARGYPAPTFSWTKAGIPVSSQGIKIVSTQKASRLVIRRVTRAHLGEYTCTAQNPAGSSEKTAELRMKGRSQSENRRHAPQNRTSTRSRSTSRPETSTQGHSSTGQVHASSAHRDNRGQRFAFVSNRTISVDMSSLATRGPTTHAVFQTQRPTTKRPQRPAADPSPTRAHPPRSPSPSASRPRSRGPTGRRPASRQVSNVDGDALELIRARLKSGRLKTRPCPSKGFCENAGKCRYVHKLAIQICLCRPGYGGQRCENVA